MYDNSRKTYQSKIRFDNTKALLKCHITGDAVPILNKKEMPINFNGVFDNCENCHKQLFGMG